MDFTASASAPPRFCTFDKPYYGTTILGSAELDCPIKLEPVQVLGSRQVNMMSFDATFKNLWDCDYYVKADEVKATLLYIHGCRCVKASHIPLSSFLVRPFPS